MGKSSDMNMTDKARRGERMTDYEEETKENRLQTNQADRIRVSYSCRDRGVKKDSEVCRALSLQVGYTRSMQSE